MRRAWLTLLVVGIVLTSSGVWRLEAQGAALSPVPGLRLEWTTEATAGKWQHVCGYLYNDTPNVPRQVRLLVEARDSSGRVVDWRVAPVLGCLVDADIGGLDRFKRLSAYLTGLLLGALLTALTASWWVSWLPYVVGP